MNIKLEWFQPITHFIRQYLAAASIISNEGFADAKALALAKELISQKSVLDCGKVS